MLPATECRHRSWHLFLSIYGYFCWNYRKSRHFYSSRSAMRILTSTNQTWRQGQDNFYLWLGTYRYTFRPFGLQNAPVKFQRGSNIILSGDWRNTIFFSVNDSLLFKVLTQTSQGHLWRAGTTLLGGCGSKATQMARSLQNVESIVRLLMHGRLSTLP